MHEAQMQVSGDHVDVQYMTSDAHGIQHDVHMEMNQMANEPKVVTDSYAQDGLSNQIISMNDGSQRAHIVGPTMATMVWNGESFTEPVTMTADLYRPDKNSPWQGNVTARSSEQGDFQYSLSDVQSDDLGAPDMSKPMTVMSGTGNDQFRLGHSWEGMAVAETSGPNGENLMEVHGGGQNVGLTMKDGSSIPLHGVTITGVGTRGPDKQPTDLNVTAQGMDDNGMQVTAKGKLSVDSETHEKVLDVSTAQWEAKFDGHSSGTIMRVGQSDGIGGFELTGGGVQYDGNPNSATTPWHYHGQIKDLSTGETYMGDMHFDGKELYASNMFTGQEKVRVADDGAREFITGSLDSENGQRVQRTETGRYLYPTGQRNAAGEEILQFRDLDVTQTIRRSRDPLDHEKTVDTVVNTTARGTNSKGTTAVDAVVTKIAPGDKVALPSDTSLRVQDGSYSSGPDGQSADDRLVGMPVVRPISGTQGADLRYASIRQGAHGLEVHEEQRQPGTNRKAVARVRGLDEEFVEFNGGAAHLVRSNDPDHRSQILSGGIDGRLEITRPETLSLKGISGPVKAMVRREVDPRTGETVHASLENGMDGNVWGAKQLPGNRVESGIISFKGKDEHGDAIFDFRATSTAHVEEGSNEKFASQLVIDKSGQRVLSDDAVGGTSASWRHTRHDDIRYALESNVIGADASESHSDPLVLSDNQRTGMEIGSAVDGAARLTQDFGWLSRPLGRGRSRKSPGNAGGASSHGPSSSGNPSSGGHANPPSSPHAPGGGPAQHESNAQLNNTLSKLNQSLDDIGKKLSPAVEDNTPKILDQFGRPYKH